MSENISEAEKSHLITKMIKERVKDTVVPPFCFEVFLNNGSSHYLHSLFSQDIAAEHFFSFRIWDFRDMAESDVYHLKKNLNNSEFRKRIQVEDAFNLYPNLDWALIVVPEDNVSYFIEWHDRRWSIEELKKIGFSLE